MHLIKKINYIDGFKISVTFDDKKTKIVDLESYLDKGIFLQLRDLDYFKLVKVKYDTLVWPNDADFCPDVLYEIGEDIKEKKEKKNSEQRKQISKAATKKPSNRRSCKSSKNSI